jgi:tetratricopeptide (TPR) repeat protein
VYYDQKYAQDPTRWISNLCSLLNRADIFADWTTTSSVAFHWSGPADDEHIGVWNFLRQVIIGWELAVRLKNLEESRGYTGFTTRILATLIISELWLKNVEIILADSKPSLEGMKHPETPAEKARAEDYKNKANDALKKNDYQKAIDLYTEAIQIDSGNSIYWCNRSAAQVGLEKYEEAEYDAYIGTQIDPKYAKAWSRLGMAMLKLGHPKRAKKAYERALEVAGKEATTQMRQGLASADNKIFETAKAISEEKNEEKQYNMRTAFLDEDWEIFGKTAEFHSLIHEQQVEGLLLFAERMKWPYINELRDYAEDVYSNLRGGTGIDIDLHDWLYGLVLPGKWFSFKIMTALILCTPSIKSQTGISRYYECGLSLPTRSYWRLRTVLGRVLGCLPGVLSLCGWIGPCPRVEFDPPVLTNRPRHVRIKTRRIALTEHSSDSDDGVTYLRSGYDRYSATRIGPDEEMEPYLAEMRDQSNWIIPEPPIRDISTCEIELIQLKELALDIGVAQKAAKGELNDLDVELETQYRASITFKIDNNQRPITYKLFTNPVFVTPPPCRLGPKGPHEVHMRELPRFQRNIWPIDRLKDHTPEDSDGDEVMVINATGKGAEVLARAWCSERGKNAVICRAGGPCFVCAVRAASKGSLGTGVLIWTE